MGVMKVVTAAIIQKGEMVLIARRAPQSKLAGLWEFPGGKVEELETPAQCLARELQEELNIQAEVGEHVCSSEYHYSHGSFRIEAYFAHWVDGQILLKDHDMVEWALPFELENYALLPADIPIARMLAHRHNTPKS